MSASIDIDIVHRPLWMPYHCREVTDLLEVGHPKYAEEDGSMREIEFEMEIYQDVLTHHTCIPI